MRKEFRQRTRQYFRDSMTRLDQPFEPYRDERYRWLNERDTLFRRPGSAAGSASFVVLVFPSTQMLAQEFTLELAFSSGGNYPAELLPGQPIDRFMGSDLVAPADPPTNGSFRCRIGAFFAPNGDHWWKVSDYGRNWNIADPDTFIATLKEEPESALGRIEREVADAVDHFRRYALPFLAESGY